MRVKIFLLLAIGLQLLLIEGCGKGSAPVQAPASSTSNTTAGAPSTPSPTSGGTSSSPSPSPRKVTLQWAPNPPDNLVGYKVYYSEDSPATPFQGTGATEGSSPVDVSNQTTATISGLDPAHTYYFAVTAYNSAGQESPYSNVVSVP